jgi:hypothetical protein
MLFLAVFCFVAVATGCTPSVTVNHDYDTEYDFAPLKVYAWLPIKSTGNVSELRIRRFVNAVNSQLQAQGYTLSTDNPDFLVAVHGATKEQINVTNWGYGYGPRWGRGWGAGYGDIDVSQWTEGTIFVDIVDAGSRNMVWRGSAQTEVDDSASPEKQEQRYADIVARLFAKFPPES